MKIYAFFKCLNKFKLKNMYDFKKISVLLKNFSSPTSIP